MIHLPGGINLILIMAVALLVFGPNKLPEIARSMGKAMSEFKNAIRDVTETLDFHANSHDTHGYSGTNTALAESRSTPSYQYASDYAGVDPHSPDPHFEGAGSQASDSSSRNVSSGTSSIDSSHGGSSPGANQSMLIG